MTYSRIVLLTLVFFLTLSTPPTLAEETTAPFLGSTVRLASVESGAEFIGSSDEWTRFLSDFDRSARLRSTEPVNEEKFLEYAASQVVSWDESTTDILTRIVEDVGQRVKELGLDLPLPDEVLIVRTTGKEEMGDRSYYTRGETIVVSDSQIQFERARHIFLHELFHVMSRHAPEIRKGLYRIIGFEHCGSIPYPEALRERRVTNPDAFHFDSYVDVEFDGTTIHVVPLTLARKTPYEKGSLMENLSIEFLELEPKSDGKGMQAKLRDGKPVLHGLGTVDGYQDRIGRNTGYIIHPEEIMAENFAAMVLGKKDLPNPEILTAIQDYFAKP